MSVLGVVGSTELTDDERQVVVDYVSELLDNDNEISEILHLHSTGVEETVVNIASERGLPNESIAIYNHTWNAGKIQGVVPGTFKDANIKLIVRCDLLLVMTTARDKSGGPLWAAKRARKLQKPVIQKTFVAPVTRRQIEVIENEVSPSSDGSAE
jgi:hypothetical protein